MKTNSGCRRASPAWWSIGLVTLALHGCVLDAVWPAPNGASASSGRLHVRTIAATVHPETGAAGDDVARSSAVQQVQVADPARHVELPRQHPVARVGGPRRSASTGRVESSDGTVQARREPTLLLVAAETDSPTVADPPSVATASAEQPGPVSVPTYRTTPPPATHLAYDLRHGMLSGQGDITWAPSGPRYTLSLEGRIASLTLLTQISTGGFDAHGLAPERYTDQRMKRAVNAANLQRGPGKVTFSGPSTEYPLLPGTQDRVSWMVQLAAVITAQPELAKPGAKVTLFVVGARGEGDVWVFVCTGSESVDTGVGPMRADKFIREPTKPNDTQVEAWLAPQLHGLPAHARLSNGNDGALDLILRRVD